MNSNTNFYDPTARSKYRSELAAEYGISVRTLYRWMKKTNLDIPYGLIDPYHLRIIYKKFGIPEKKKNSKSEFCLPLSTFVHFFQLLYSNYVPLIIEIYYHMFYSPCGGTPSLSITEMSCTHAKKIFFRDSVRGLWNDKSGKPD